MKKTISLILCAALFCSIFAACSNADSSDKTDESVEADNVQRVQMVTGRTPLKPIMFK